MGNKGFYKTIHLFCLGAAIGLILAGVFVKMGRVEHIPPEKWFIPFVVGIIFLGLEYLIQRKPR